MKCAGTGTLVDCRKAVLNSLDQALAELGGLGNQASWDGSRIPNAKGKSGAKVEDYDAVEHTSFSFLPVPPTGVARCTSSGWPPLSASRRASCMSTSRGARC